MRESSHFSLSSSAETLLIDLILALLGMHNFGREVEKRSETMERKPSVVVIALRLQEKIGVMNFGEICS